MKGAGLHKRDFVKGAGLHKRDLVKRAGLHKRDFVKGAPLPEICFPELCMHFPLTYIYFFHCYKLVLPFIYFSCKHLFSLAHEDS